MTAGRPLTRPFYLRPVRTVARALLGKTLVRRSGNTLFAGTIVEVEAYGGNADPASHAYHGPSPRNAVMFGEGGHLYVYFTYGMHFCANVVTGMQGTGSAVLLRALEPADGIGSMHANRGGGTLPLHALLSGPAKLCQAFGIGRAENGLDLCGEEMWIEDRGVVLPRRTIRTTERIGITHGRDHRWRYVICGSPFLSRPVPCGGNAGRTVPARPQRGSKK